MAGATVSVSVSGFENLNTFLARMQNPDFTELMDSIGGLIVSQTEQRIKKDKKAPDGTAWPELSERYADRKKKGGGILELMGDLRDSLTHLVSGRSVEVGTNVIYAATHQFGDPKRNIPQREFLGLSAENEAAINGLIDKWIQKQLAA